MGEIEDLRAEAWRCEAHGITTLGDCPRCDDELIALSEADLLPGRSPAADMHDDTGAAEGGA